MGLSKLEQETIILFNEKEPTASVFCHNAKLAAKLKRLSEKYPDLAYPDRPESSGAVSYVIPKSCVSIREPYSPERRKADSARAKAAGVVPPNRNKPVS